MIAVGGLMVAACFGIYSQEKSSANEGKSVQLANAADDPKYQGDYLEEFHYARTLDSTKSRLLDQIHALNIIVKNFGSQVQGSPEELESVKKMYTDALRYYYRRQYIVAGRKMKETEKSLDKLFGRFSDQYNQRADQLLGECADTIVGLEQMSMGSQDAKAVRGRDIASNHHKLQIAYYQMIQADRMRRDYRFKDSLIHLRLAKEYGISILSGLKSEEEGKNIREKYKIDLSDNRNMVYSEGPAKGN
ncbi:hypothetical protein [Leptospira perolatii]